ncbi:hypothetical protein U1Q18_043344 [Sarracenia purpurea var. burkii]
MSSEGADPKNIPAKLPKNDHESLNSGCRKPTPRRPPQEALKCPRCSSPNTKFCYYNNYSLTQPRHFCKACRRYWTKGGALRKVPIGGGCRRNKRTKSTLLPCGSPADLKDPGEFKFFHGASLSPHMDFQLGGLSLSSLHSSTASVHNRFSSFGDSSTASSVIFSPPFLGNFGPKMGNLGMSFLFSPIIKQGENGGTGDEVQDMGLMNVQSNLVSSMEFGSFMNQEVQDLHWKLQQQRCVMSFHEEKQKERSFSSVSQENQDRNLQPMIFQNPMISKPEVCTMDNSGKGGVSGNITTECFLENSYYRPSNPTPANSSSNGASENTSNWNGYQSWTGLN